MKKGWLVLILISLLSNGLTRYGLADPLPQDGTTEETAPQESLPDAAEPLFEVTDYRIDGNTILPKEKIEQAVAPYRGPKQRLADVEAARGALEKIYHDEGYPTVLVVVPEQTIENGVVLMTVVESKIGEITVTGNRSFLKSSILGRLPSLRPGALLYEPTVTKELNRVNANPDLKVAPVLTPGSEPGTVDLELKVEDRLPFHGSLEWNNRGTPNSPRHRLNGSIQYTNLFDRDQILTFQTTQTPEEWGAVQVYGLSYVAPLRTSDHLFVAYAARSDSESVLDGSSLPIFPGNIDIVGNATVVGARYLFPLGSAGKTNHQLSLGLDYKRLGKNEASFPGELGTALISNQIHYAPASVAYTGFQVEQRGITKFSFSVRGYIAGTVPKGGKEDFAGDPSDPINMPGNRQGATGTFAVFQAGAERLQNLPKQFDLSLKLDGQVATEPLISAEQYFAGGIETVRGYLENEALGDDAVRGTLELLSPPFPTLFSGNVKESLRLTAFYDAAFLWVREAPPGQKDHHGLGGIGVGAQLKLTEYFQGRLDHAWALRETALTGKGDRFLHFSIKAAF